MSLTVACLSTWRPRRCGIATFARDLARAVRHAMPGIELPCAAIDSARRAYGYGPEVRWRVRQGRPETYRRLATQLNQSAVDLVSLQHEFGLYGAWGERFEDHLAPFLAALDRPLVATLHTVLPHPSTSVRAAVQRLVARCQVVVVMTDVARRLLVGTYLVDPGKVVVIGHGVPAVSPTGRTAAKAALGLAGRFVISTFGLLDRRKGIHLMIDAMRTVAARLPRALYLVLGATHPDVVADNGEQYRDELHRQVVAHGLRGHVRFVNRFLPRREVVDHLLASDVYVTPYLDADQICSGTLAYALGAGRAVISTPYLHAVEALDGGRGLLTAAEPAQLADAVLRLGTSPALRHALEKRAYDYGRTAAWPLVGERFSALYAAVAAR